MAVIGLFGCQVLVDGKALEERRYEEDDDDSEYPEATEVATRYIEAVPGANFTIKLDVMPGYCFGNADHLGADFKLDGQLQDRPVIAKSHYSKSEGYSYTHFGVYSRTGTESTIRKYHFGNITTREPSPSDAIEDLKSKYGQLGSIKVEFWRKALVSEVSYGDVNYGLRATEAVPEKALKGRALTLETRLGEVEAAQARPVWNGRELDAGPVAVFEFKYRSKKSLQELLVIPRSPSPVPLEERPIEELNIEELRELTRKQKAEVDAARLRVKEEPVETDIRTLRAVKRNREDTENDMDNDGRAAPMCPAPKKKRSDEEIEAIDLFD